MTVAAARAQVGDLERSLNLDLPDRRAADLAGQLAGCYFMLGRRREALYLYSRVWEVKRTVDLAISYCVALRDVGRFTMPTRAPGMRGEARYADVPGADELSEYAWILAPENDYVRLLQGEALLRAGHWKRAWPIYDDSRMTKFYERLRAELPGRYRQWDGRDLGEEDFLVVLMEGGAGDRFNYARWLGLLGAKAKNWKVAAPLDLAGFFERWLGADRVVRIGEDIADGGMERCWWTTVFSLPANFCAGPANVPQWSHGDAMGNDSAFLEATEQAGEKYHIERSGNDRKFLAGIAWAAGEVSPIDDPETPRVRSLSEAQAMRIVCQTADKVHWVSVMKDKKLAPPVAHAELASWEDTAGLLENLDCLLTVDAGVMHLAGAMCKPLAILLGSNSDWKFLAAGKCPFYRSAQLYRNGPGGGFENAINRAILAIRERGLGAFG